MNLSQSSISEDSIKSLQHWWSLAGVDIDYNDEARSLLSAAEPEKAQSAETSRDGATVPAKSDKLEETVTAYQPPTSYPGDYSEFMEWLSAPDNLLEKSWGKSYVLPKGALEPEVMAIMAMPDTGGDPDSGHFSDKSQKLFENMMRAIGCDSEKLYVASLSLARSIDGRIGSESQNHLKDRMMHLIALVKPKRIIIFGEGASQVLFHENLLAARKKTQFINHVSSTTEAIVTFHPRMLLDRPEFKAEAWKDLQLLPRISAS